MDVHPSYSILVSILLFAGCSSLAERVASTTQDRIYAPAPPPDGEKWRPGVDYNILVPDPSHQHEQIEILELSMYTTYSTYPSAVTFRPILQRWLEKHQSAVTYVRQPSIFAGMNHAKLQARVFFALEKLGRSDLQEKFELWVRDPRAERTYHAIWNPDEAAVYGLSRDFAKENGIAEADFNEAYHSSQVDQQVIQMLTTSAWAKMDGSPTFVIDGRFSVSAQRLAYPRRMPEAADFDRLLRLIDYLVSSQLKTRHDSGRNAPRIP